MTISYSAIMAYKVDNFPPNWMWFKSCSVDAFWFLRSFLRHQILLFVSVRWLKNATVPAFILTVEGRLHFQAEFALKRFRLPKVSASNFDHYERENRILLLQIRACVLSNTDLSSAQICFALLQIFCHQYTSIYKPVTVCIVSVFMFY